ncbi:type II toxin-antitoxin system PemK/MazF family toxin [Verrucomicrobiales bacterium BCK34]|nr:type II toxin-antitoxin system PemK/MazF family toxin [Verrucomicrobiales bacterium BCK34]
MIPGALILARLQQSDGQIKRRPALILTTMPPYNDLLVCGVSSQLKQEVPGFDEVISVSAPDFLMSGLKVSSVMRLGMIATIPRSAALGELGSISPERLIRLRDKLANHIDSDEGTNR